MKHHLMRTVLLFFLTSVFVVACQKFEWHNPFDPECPKDLFTPSDFVGTSELRSIKLAWSQPIENISGFTIYRSVANGQRVQIATLGKEARTYADADVQHDKSYAYFIVANAGENKSNESTTQLIFKVAPPLSPTDLRATVQTTTRVQLIWTDKSTDELGFKIDRKLDNGNYTLIATLGADITSFIDSTVTEGLTYTYRVYSFNQGGASTTYTNELQLTMLLLPQLTTASLTGITVNAAQSGGIDIKQNGSPITARGIVWSTAQNPTIALSTKTTNGTGTANFVAAISGLTPGTTYFVRSWATNQAGTAYGNQIQFSTLQAALPSITTLPASNITMNAVNIGGTISSDGGYPIIAKGIVWDLMPQPTVSMSTKTSEGTGTTAFVSSITGLNSSTVYFARAYATTQLGTSYGNDVSFTTSATNATTGTPITDIDGNSYKTIVVGTQEWMAENLKTTKFNDGTPIQLVEVQSTWTSFTSSAYCDYDNSPSIAAAYGKLYNYYAVTDAKNLCPQGWRIPTLSDWNTLEGYLGASLTAKKLKATSGWLGDGANGTNETGFTALPGGFRDDRGFGLLGILGYWWTSSAVSPTSGTSILMSINSYIEKPVINKIVGVSVRCIKGN